MGGVQVGFRGELEVRWANKDYAGLRLGVSGIAQALEIGNNERFVLSYTHTDPYTQKPTSTF